jgi:glycosyltransferase involved in cell wall biosynthesis
MNLKAPLTVIILTYNEAVNIEQALKNVSNWAKQTLILDSCSTDATCQIAAQYPVNVFTRKFDNYANQRNYALQELPIETDWILFLDADEYLTEDLKQEIAHLLNSETDKTGFYIRRRFYFMGKWIKYGGYYPTWILRLFKKGHVKCEREINEHFVLVGEAGYLKNDFVDNNLKNFTDWVDKHNRYSSFESYQFEQTNDKLASLWGAPVERTQWVRQNIWNKLIPPLIRPFVLFFYTYFLRLGFLNGIPGLLYHTMHAFVYPLMIDIKYLERKWRLKNTSIYEHK